VSELGFGRAIHHVLRRIAEETRAAARVPDLAQIDMIMDQELYFPFANKSSEPLMRTKARSLVTHYINRHRDDLLRIWATERPFELHLPEGFLSGRADVILDREGGIEGSLAILDYKSGTDGTSDANFRFQLQVYAAAARAEGLTVDAAYLHDLANRNDPRSDVPVGDQACTGAIDRARRIFGELSQRSFVPKPDPVRCGRCELREICRHRDAGC
jgi:DNA helicase-2/ATP-dependent DNA helicase PcrA